MKNENSTFHTKSEEILDQLMDLVSEGKEVKFLNLTAVKSADLYALVNRLHTSLLEDLHDAIEIRKQRQELLQEAEAEANELYLQAKYQVENHDFVNEAKLYAKKILSEATETKEKLLAEGHEQKNQIITEGLQFVDSLLETCESAVTETESHTTKALQSSKTLLSESRKQVERKAKEQLQSFRYFHTDSDEKHA